jgi:hypothetical protein
MKGYKTVAVNGAAALIPIVDLVVNNGAILAAITPTGAATALSVLGLVNVILRWVTTTPIFKSE